MTGTAVSGEVAKRIERIEHGLHVMGTPGGRPIGCARLRERMEHYAIPGVSIAVINNLQIEWAKGYGTLGSGKPAPVTPESLFQAASISKPITAVATLRLVEQGHLDLDEDVNTYLTSWKVPANDGWQPRVTLRQLLSHSAGMTVHGFPGFLRDQEQPSLLQVLEGAKPSNTAPIRVDTLPGTQFRYSGGGYSVLQQLFVDVTGKRFAELMQDLVLEPLGMEHSLFEQPLSDAQQTDAAAGHRWSGEPIPGGGCVYPQLAAAGLWTTPSDLVRFALDMQLARAGRPSRLLSSAMVNELLCPQLDEPVGLAGLSPKGRIGLGILLDGTGESSRFLHAGGNQGFISWLVGYRDTGIGAAVMTNADSGAVLIAEILAAIAEAYDWPGYRSWHNPLVTIHPSTVDTYVGAYELKSGQRLLVSRRDGGLVVQLESQDPLDLYPESESRFVATAIDLQINFDRADDDQVTGLRLRQNGREQPATLNLER
ncbi:MAG: serine hydrolase [Dehalococcoidia bacterium]